jgi:hypothetical protein
MDFLHENEQEIVRNIIQPELFIPDSFELIKLGMNISLIVGILKDQKLVTEAINPAKKTVQGVKFLKPDWDMQDALAWLNENQRFFKEDGTFDKKTFKKDLKEIKGVEVFSAGTWNGDTYTTKDLDEMVKAFNETSETVRPFLKLGHSDNQKLLQAEGLPAAGWIGKIYRKGEKLVADFVDIPNKIYELIENKAYRNVSSEIYFDVDIKDSKYKMLLSAVALLGAETPAVMNLSDIMSRFGLKGYKSIKTFADSQKNVTIKTYSTFNDTNSKTKGQNMSKTENEIALELKLKEAQDKIEKQAEQTKQFEADLKAKATELEESNKKKKEAELKVFEAEKAKKETEMEAQVDTLINEKLISKSMKPFALALLANKVDEKTKKYSFKSGDEDKNLDRFELIKEFASLAKTVSDVNFDENSDEGKKASDNGEDQIAKFAKENDLEYSEAYRQFNAGKLTVEKPHVTEE